MGWRILVNFIPRLWLDNLYLRLRTMLYTIYAAKFEQTIIYQHVHLRRESLSHAPAHVLIIYFFNFHENESSIFNSMYRLV
jgi:hypothetical protein